MLNERAQRRCLNVESITHVAAGYKNITMSGPGNKKFQMMLRSDFGSVCFMSATNEKKQPQKIYMGQPRKRNHAMRRDSFVLANSK